MLENILMKKISELVERREVTQFLTSVGDSEIEFLPCLASVDGALYEVLDIAKTAKIDDVQILKAKNIGLQKTLLFINKYYSKEEL